MSIQKQLGELSTATGRQDEILQRIDTQVQKTNGRVTALEKVNNELREKEAEERGETKIKNVIWGALGGLVIFSLERLVNKIL